MNVLRILRMVIAEGVVGSCLHLASETISRGQEIRRGKRRVVIRSSDRPSFAPSMGVYAYVRTLYGRDIAQNCIITHHQLIHYI